MRGNQNIGLLIMITVAWWGLMYPEFCLSENVVKIVYDITIEENKQDNIENETENSKQEETQQNPLQAEEVWPNLLSAEPENVVIKSRIYEYIKATFEKS